MNLPALIQRSLSLIDQAMIAEDPITQLAVLRRELLTAQRDQEAELSQLLPPAEPLGEGATRSHVGGPLPTTHRVDRPHDSGLERRNRNLKVKQQKRPPLVDRIRAAGGRLDRPTGGPLVIQVGKLGGEILTQDVECPACGAQPGFACVGLIGHAKGEFIADFHAQRLQAAKAANANTVVVREPIEVLV